MDLRIGILHGGEYLFGFEVIPSEVCRSLCTASTPYSVVFGVAILRAGEVILTEQSSRSG